MIKLDHVIYHFTVSDILLNLKYNYNLDKSMSTKIVYYVIYKTLVDLGYNVEQHNNYADEIKILLENFKFEFRNEIKFLLNNAYVILNKISFFQNPNDMNKFVYKIDVTDSYLTIIGKSKGR